MSVPQWVEKIGRTIFEAPFSGQDMKDTPELAEIRLAVLDEVKAKSQCISGRRVFPYNTVRVLIRVVNESDGEEPASRFLSQMLEAELRAGLKKSGCRFPDDLEVEVRTAPGFPAQGEGWISVEAASRARPARTTVRRSARLVVLRGAANQAELAIHKIRTNIGRTVEVSRADGPSRRNDLAFTDDGVSSTVSREHAHILYSRKTGEYRLFNDRFYRTSGRGGGNCGLWIIRDGLSQAVHKDSRGVRLKSGDEIQFGSAVVRFLLK
jgi:hypothetical protein